MRNATQLQQFNEVMNNSIKIEDEFGFQAPIVQQERQVKAPQGLSKKLWYRVTSIDQQLNVPHEVLRTNVTTKARHSNEQIEFPKKVRLLHSTENTPEKANEGYSAPAKKVFEKEVAHAGLKANKSTMQIMKTPMVELSLQPSPVN